MQLSNCGYENGRRLQKFVDTCNTAKIVASSPDLFSDKL